MVVENANVEGADLEAALAIGETVNQ